jgi:hypothetical protein
MNPEPELDAWRKAWRTPAQIGCPTAGFDVRRAHSRQERRLRRDYLLSLTTAIGLVALVVWVLRTSFSAEAVVWAAVVVLTTAGATAFQVWNWRTLWKTAARSVSDYANLYEHRCLAELRAVRFGYGLLALQTSITAPWLTWDFARGEIPAVRFAIGMGLLALLIAGFIIYFRMSRRRAVRELAQVTEFRQEMQS